MGLQILYKGLEYWAFGFFIRRVMEPEFPYTSLLDGRGAHLPAPGLFCMFHYINKGLLLQTLDSWGLVKDSQKLLLKIPRILMIEG